MFGGFAALTSFRKKRSKTRKAKLCRVRRLCRLLTALTSFCEPKRSKQEKTFDNKRSFFTFFRKKRSKQEKTFDNKRLVFCFFRKKRSKTGKAEIGAWALRVRNRRPNLNRRIGPIGHIRHNGRMVHADAGDRRKRQNQSRKQTVVSPPRRRPDVSRSADFTAARKHRKRSYAAAHNVR